MSQATAAIRIKNLSKKIGKKEIVKDLSLEVSKGEIFGFLGANGAGKTTTIRMMCGLFSIDKGDIEIEGHSVSKEFEKAVSKIGAIIEYPNMYDHLTGRQNLKQYARMHEGITDERINEVVRIVKMERAIDDKFKTYSLGMKQRLGLAQALLHKPSVLILDEPMNGLDPLGIKELRSMLRHLASEENTAIFVSSHILSEMEMLCDTVGILDHGRLLEVHDVREILENSISLEDRFFEITSMPSAAIN